MDVSRVGVLYIGVLWLPSPFRGPALSDYRIVARIYFSSKLRKLDCIFVLSSQDIDTSLPTYTMCVTRPRDSMFELERKQEEAFLNESIQLNGGYTRKTSQKSPKPRKDCYPPN